MKLIADAGGTKTRWCMVEGDGNICKTVVTAGINAVTTSVDQIRRIVAEELMPQLAPVQASEVYYYGAGVIGPDQEAVITDILTNCLGPIKTDVHSDLLGTARALCGSAPGIACILGTGSNSCYYDGNKIVANTSPLGYILGDEGSGASIGKRFLNALFKNRLPSQIVDLWKKDCDLTLPQVIERVYRRPGANAFLASVVPFVSRHVDQPILAKLVDDEFSSFISNNIKIYGKITNCKNLFFTGSIARVFESQLREVTQNMGYKIEKIVDDPLPLLVIYHSSSLRL